MVETSLWWKPVNGGKFYFFITIDYMINVFKKHLYGGNLFMVETCLWWKLVYGGNRSMVETSLWWKI